MIPIETRGETKIGISAIAVNAIRNELTRMTKMAKENVALSFDASAKATPACWRRCANREEYIDFLNKEISKYISRMLVKERNPKDSQYMSVLFKVCGNLERIGDHAMNICEYTNMIQEKQISFSAEVIKQIGQMKEVCNQALDMVLGVEQNGGGHQGNRADRAEDRRHDRRFPQETDRPDADRRLLGRGLCALLRDAHRL